MPSCVVRLVQSRADKSVDLPDLTCHGSLEDVAVCVEGTADSSGRFCCRELDLGIGVGEKVHNKTMQGVPQVLGETCTESSSGKKTRLLNSGADHLLGCKLVTTRGSPAAHAQDQRFSMC